MKLKIKKEVEVDVKTLHVRAGVRYWEDATVNGVEDVQGDLIPCRDVDNWKPIINIETGQITNWEQGKTADIHYKICDDGDYYLKDDKDEEVIRQEGYVPKTLCPEKNGYGDYIIMRVDENGFIKNWKFDVSNFIEEED
jgi:hypothetical protein